MSDLPPLKVGDTFPDLFREGVVFRVVRTVPDFYEGGVTGTVLQTVNEGVVEYCFTVNPNQLEDLRIYGRVNVIHGDYRF